MVEPECSVDALAGLRALLRHKADNDNPQVQGGLAGVSHTELPQWVNEPLRINYTEVEQCGAGGTYRIQVLDSIYAISQWHASRWAQSKTANCKIMLNAFKVKKLDKTIG
ncbi:hypothetical protein DFH07DRAFT_957321 [Mycena maculata]|uniref:Uncharacterized protein n=1 Tax=Mycena maculata TaxID=230809 RepID=A0AAD7NI04_9AGAR|nr:hypothetical protein DFH07DRAFT_957321 [Mycena maculata]